MMQDVEMQDVEATNGGHNVAKTGTIQITPFRIMAREDIVTAKRSRKRARSPIVMKGDEKWKRGTTWSLEDTSIDWIADSVRNKKEKQSFSEWETSKGHHHDMDKWLSHIISMRQRTQFSNFSPRTSHDAQTVDDNLLDYNGPKTLKDLMIEARMRALDGLEVNANRQLTDEPVRQKERRDVIAPGLHAVDRLKSLPVSFTINLFPGGFSIDGMTEAHPYDQHSRDFLKCLDLGRLPGDMIMDRCGDFEFQYFDGCLIVEIKDHRMPKQYDLKPHVHRVVLQPSNQSVANDLKVIWHRNQGLSLDDILQLEQNMLMALQPSICLDPHPRVGKVLSLISRSLQRVHVWHPRNARPEFSKFRRTFDFEAMRKMHNTIYNWNRDPNATQKLEKLAKTRAMRVSGIRGFLQQQHEWEEAEKNEATAGVSAILKLFSSNGGQQQSGASGTLGSPPPLATPKMGLNSPGPMNRALLVRESMVPGAPAERQMRFKKDLQVSSIWLQAKAPSSYYVYMRMEDVTKEGKIVEGSQAQLPASYIGNSQSARRFGSQQYDIMVREGWQPLSDSHIGKKREANSPSSSSIPPPSTAATGQNGSTSAPPSQVLSTNPVAAARHPPPTTIKSPPAQHAKVIGSSPTPSAHPAASYPPGVPVRPMTAANSRPAGKAGVQPHTLPGGVSSMYTGATQARPYTAPGGQRNIPTSAVPHVQPGHAYQSGVVRPAGTPVSSAAAAAAAAASMMHRPGAGVVGGVGSYAGMACQPPQMKQSGMPGPKDPPKK